MFLLALQELNFLCMCHLDDSDFCNILEVTSVLMNCWKSSNEVWI